MHGTAYAQSQAQTELSLNAQLLVAARNDDIPNFRRMLDEGAAVNSRNRSGDTALIIFARKGNDLTVTVPITFPEASLGADIAVPTLEGAPVTLRIPAGTRSGRTFRVKGRGVTTAKAKGDLLATVEVAVPSKLSAAERKALEAFQAASDGASPREHLGV